ncbi:hypothetical protein [Haloarcula sp. JP-L23]|uniref:hypothetical protein n=1 Tax=Haloarcula sp. JP-L23 TaxID=2716717 RepID=UPI00140EB550|nr:hypothetical protein G9465_03045 [Haloarcula sp. JP-L23]
MGLFDSIRRAVGGGDDGSEQTEARSDLVDVTALGPDEFRDRAENAASDGDPLDFSVTSLERLDEAIAGRDDWTEDTPSDGTAYSPKAVQFGSYFGEVLVRTYDGEWTAEDGWAVAVAGPDDEVTVDVFEVAAQSVAGDPVFAVVAERVADERRLDATDSAETVDDADTTQDSAETDEGDADTATGATADHEDGALTAPEADPIEADETTDAPSEDVGEANDDTVTADPTASGGAAGTVADEVYPTMDAVEAPPEVAPESDADVSAGSPAASGAADHADPETTDAEREGEAAPASDPPADDGLRAEYAAAATEFTDFWAERDLDFTPASLARLDDLVGTEWDDDRFEDATFGSEATFDDRAFTSVTTELGSYFGEVLVRELDGEWSADADHEAVVVVSGTDGPLAVPVFQVAANSLRTVPVFARSYEALLADLGRDA